MSRLNTTHYTSHGETSKRRLRFYAELFVEHPPSEVWSYFSDLSRWRQWSPICRGCRLSANHGELCEGSTLQISFAILGFSMTVPCRVIQFDPPRSITWQGEKFGTQATHTYRFIPRHEGTLLCNEEMFDRVSVSLKGLMRAWYRASKLSEASLQGLRRELSKTSNVSRSHFPTVSWVRRPNQS